MQTVAKRFRYPTTNNSLLHASIATFPKGPTFWDWYNGEVDPSWLFLKKILK
jgi:hypothetical protein